MFKKLEKKLEINVDLLLDRDIKEQFEYLRYIVEKNYKIDYITSFIKSNEKYTFLGGSENIKEETANSSYIDMPILRYNKNSLLDSKVRNIKARFSIPLKIGETEYLIIMESKNYKILYGNEKNIYKQIFDFKNALIELKKNDA
ncbi:hypothetical protein [Clostridium akagii]|uniref:hypothetical protein n=1 Tax=Clostridium akagii TaxID=91623 RepID=UPI00047A96C3|nr:hypothetical protein [Clostridium akagii]